ncbi:MAG: hypothetical protein LBB90_09475, partial [Tannerella sp.]|nr:hypothetical protein [Tannerella sp.]
MKRLHLTEDWSATVVGWLFIAVSLVIFGVSQGTWPAADLGWANGSELLAVFSTGNLLRLLPV